MVFGAAKRNVRRVDCDKAELFVCHQQTLQLSPAIPKIVFV
jgi:hypothetical protein